MSLTLGTGAVYGYRGTDIYSAYHNIEQMTLAEFSKAYVDYFGFNDVVPTENIFSDLENDENILKMTACGFIKGNTDATVCPNEVVSETRAAVILNRIEKYFEDDIIKSKEYVYKSPNVDGKMLTPEYWTVGIKDAYKRLKTADEIENLNKSISDCEATYVINLENVSDTFDGVWLREALADFENPTELYIDGKYYTINSVSSLKQDNVKKRVRSVVVNTLDTMRMSGHTWFDDLNVVIDVTK